MDSTTLFRLLDCGKFNNSEELIDHIRNNGYTSIVFNIVPFVELEVPEYEFYEIKTILDDNLEDYRTFD